MRQFNYKCTVAKNDTKMYYRKVGGKWKRISNMMGKNAEKGKKKYRNGEKKEECTICYNNLVDPGKKVKTLLCKHKFHEKCIDKWFEENKRNETCPMCREKFLYKGKAFDFLKDDNKI